MPIRSRSLLLPALSIAACLAGGAPAGAAVLSPDTTLILSGAPSLLSAFPAPMANAFAGPQTVSKDGSVVAFSSTSDGLSGEDDDGVVNIYVKDMRTGVVTLVSRRSGPNGAPVDQSCLEPAISDDGMRVAFGCVESLDPADTNVFEDVYVRDLRTSQTILVSRRSGASGAVGPQPSSSPALDRDGTHVAFLSMQENFDGTRRSPEVYVRDVPLDPDHSSDGAVTLVSRPDETTGQAVPAGGSSSHPSISDDGTKVAFVSSDTNLVAGDTNNRSDAFVRTLGPAPKTELVSRSTAGALGDDTTSDATISGDGTALALTSAAGNFDPVNDGIHDSDVFVRTLGAAPATTLVDRAPGGAKAVGRSTAAAIDDHGTTVAFITTATNLDPAADSSPAVDVYVADLTGATPVATLASRAGTSGPAANASAGPPSLSGDGTQVLLQTGESLVGDSPHLTDLALRTIATGAMAGASRPGLDVPFVNEGGFADGGTISADGRYVVMRTIAPSLGVPAGAREAIVVRDTHTGALVLASREDGPAGAPITSEVFGPTISANGRRVAFSAFGRPGDNTSEQVWVRDLVSGSTILVSRADGGEPGNRNSLSPSISADGTRVAFQSIATNLSPDDPDPDADIYVRDLTTGTTILASRADGPAGAKANDTVFNASLSADGQHVAFETAAGNLGDGGDGGDEAVHVRDLAKGTTRLASISTDGADGNADALLADESLAAISADGSRVAFESSATNLGTAIPGDGNITFSQVWVRDLATGTTILASRADGAGGAPGDGNASQAVLSTDGRMVSFESRASNLAPGVPGGDVDEVYRRDLASGTTRLVSRGTGPAGAPAPHGGTPVGMTPDGGCVTFLAAGDLLAPVIGGDHTQVYLRTFEADCTPPSHPTPTPAVRPVLQSVSLSHARFRVGKARTAVAAAKKKRKPIPRGTVLSFVSNKAAKLSIKIERVRPGHKVKVGKGKSRKTVCKAVRKRVKRGRCTAYTRVKTLTRKIKTGRGRVALSGRIGKKPMAPGAYRLTLTARDAAGAVSAPVRRSFTVLRG